MNLKQIKLDLNNNVIVSRATFVRAIEYAIELEETLKVYCRGRKDAVKAAVSAIHFDDNSDFGTALWQVVSALKSSEFVELLEDNGSAAYAQVHGDDYEC